MTAAVRRLAPVLALLALAPPASAHRLDEYLQGTVVAIEPGGIRLSIHLTPGQAVADRVLARIDRNHDGIISNQEAAAYCRLLRRDLAVRLDGHPVGLKLTASTFPTPGYLRTGWGFIKVEFAATGGPLAAGPHRLTLENRHLPGLSVYLFNAAQPKSGSVGITKQKRNDNQSMGEIEFSLRPPGRPEIPRAR